MKTREKEEEPSDDDGPNPPSSSSKNARPWASGRVLTAEQRARKREVDRNAGRFMKKEVLERLCTLETRMQLLESRLPGGLSDLPSASSSQAQQLPSAPAANNGPSPATSHLDFYDVHHQQQQQRPPIDATSQPSGQPASRNVSVESSIETTSSRPVYSQGALDTAMPAVDNTSSAAWAQQMNTTMINHRTPPEFFSNFYRFLVTPDLTNALFMPPMAPQGREMTTEFNQLATLVRQMPTSLTCADDSINNDVIIRAALEGWEAAFARREPHICPLWRVLRQVDFWLFRNLGVVCRITTLYAMHRMYVHLVQGRPLPPWYVPSLAQTMLDHDVVIHYLPWPALREHLILHEKTDQVLNNKFWMDYAHGFHFNWPWTPFEAIYCELSDSPGGHYTLSERFLTHFSNISNFTVTKAFMDKHPNLYDLTRIERQHSFLFSS